MEILIGSVDTVVTFVLGNGQKVRVMLREGGLGTAPMSVHVSCDRTMLAIPSSNNCVHVTTPEALAQEQANINETVKIRDAAMGSELYKETM